MLVNIKDIIPEYSLPRYDPNKKKWLTSVKFSVSENGNSYEISFLTNSGRGKRRVSEFVPKFLLLDSKFKSALIAYMCEGTDLQKGINTNCAGNKGKSIQFSNSDVWLLKLIVNEFKKIGITEQKWRCYLSLFSQHNDEHEKKWWSENLGIPITRIKIKETLMGDPSKQSYNPHGRFRIEIYSSIYASLIDNLISLLRKNKI